MTGPGISRRGVLGVTTGLAAMSAMPAASAARRRLAPTPPMGWNSWNSFATTITEAQAIEQATVMARELLPAGYDIFVIDDGMNRARRAPRMRRSRCLAQPPVSGGPELFC